MMAAQANADAIPSELIERPQWVAWVLEQRNGKPTKVPKVAATGAGASSTDPATWGTHAAAQKRAAAILATRAVGGIGFVLTGDDPFAVVDLDHCRDLDTGVIADEAAAIIHNLASYTEISPSGTGVHVLIRGAVPGRGNKKMMPWGGPIEMYSTVRYITVTGDHLEGTPEAIQDAQDALNTLHRDTFPPAPPKPPTAPYSPVTMDDSELIERMMKGANGFHIRALWDGSTGGHGGDDSAADLALCNHLMFYTGNDQARTDRLFRQSGLYREKWERDDYRERTLEAAMQSNAYTGAKPKPAGTITPISRKVDGDTGEVLDAQPERFHLSDLGNAYRLVATFGDDLRFCELVERWFVWDGRHWVMDEAGRRAELYAKMVPRMIYEEGAGLEGERRVAHAKHSTRSEGRDRIRAMLDLAKGEVAIRIQSEELDTDPALLTVNNGTLDLRTGELRPHRREDYITKIIPVDFDPDATCPRWLAFLDQIMAGSPEKIAFIQRAVGYSMTASTDERVIFIPWGQGANGKSTLLETIQGLLGNYATRTATQTLMVKRYEGVPNDIAALRGQRFVFTAESEQGERLAEARIKELSGGDTLTARFMRGEWFQFAPTFKIWLATNHKPEIKGTDDAIWDRIRLIPFTVRFPEGQRTKKETLLAAFQAEYPGILAWAAQGARDWYAGGLGTPDEVRAATAAYRADMDVLGHWLAECCITTETAQANATALYHSYTAWCEEDGTKPITHTELGKRLGERGFQRRRTKSGMTWKGIGLLDDPPHGGGDGVWFAENHTLPIPLDTQGETGGDGNGVYGCVPISDISQSDSFHKALMSEKHTQPYTVSGEDAHEDSDGKEKQGVYGLPEPYTPGGAKPIPTVAVPEPPPMPWPPAPTVVAGHKAITEYAGNVLKNRTGGNVAGPYEKDAAGVGFLWIEGEKAQDFARRWFAWDGKQVRAY